MAASTRRRFPVTLACLLVLPGCAGLLDVEDTSTIGDADVRRAEAAGLWVNAALLATQSAWDDGLLLLSAASDELVREGPHAQWGALDEGTLTDPRNVALERGYPAIAAGRWVVEEAIEVLDSLVMSGADITPDQRAEIRLYGAIVHPVIADVLVDFAPGDRTESAEAIGAENMVSLYDRAIELATEGLALQSTGPLARDLHAARARARHARRIRERILPTPADTSGGGLVADDDVVTDAYAALALDAGDWRYSHVFSLAADLTSGTTGQICGNIPNLRFAPTYVWSAAPSFQADSVRITDPLEGIPDPWVERVTLETVRGDGCFFPSLDVFSAREMNLLIAEDALARTDTTTFATHINGVRAAEGLTPWTTGSGITARDILIYERQTQLFLTGRRLLDLYRFGQTSPSWVAGSDAIESPGTLFPIPASEGERNCHLNGSCE